MPQPPMNIAQRILTLPQYTVVVIQKKLTARVVFGGGCGFLLPSPIFVLRHLFQEFRARVALLEMVFVRYEVRYLVRIPLRSACERGESERQLMNADAGQTYRLGRELRNIQARRVEQFLELKRADIRLLAPRCEYDTSTAYFPGLEREQERDGEKGKEKDNKGECHILFYRKTFESYDDYLLSELLDGGINEPSDGDTWVLHKRLFEKHAVAQIAVHLAFNSFGACRFGDLGGFFREDLPRGLEVALFDIIARSEVRAHRGDVHRDIVRELGEFLVLGYEIGLAAQNDRTYDC